MSEVIPVKIEKVSLENVIALALKEIKIGSPTIKASSLKVYERQIRKLYNEMKAQVKPFDFFKTDETFSCPRWWLDIPKDVIEWLNNSPWGTPLSERTIKNYISVIMSLVRNHKKYSGNPYEVYFNHFSSVKASADAKQELQQPKESELDLKDLDMDKLGSFMKVWEKKTKGNDNKNAYAGFMYALGHLHLDQVLRNEACEMVITAEYLVQQDYPDTNFIWNKGRNMKLMVIRNNKVRNPERGDPAKEVWLKGKVNTALNKYIQILERNDIYKCKFEECCGKDCGGCDKKEVPFCWSVKKKRPEFMSSSNFSQQFRNLFEPKGYPISTTQLRKVYSIDIRNKYNGNLIKEKEACMKLDHSKDTHDKHYVLQF